MPQFTQETQTGPTYASALLVGEGHLIVDRLMAPSLTLPAGQVVGVDAATGAFGALDSAIHTTSLTGATGTDTFDLGHDGIDPSTLVVTVAGALRMPGTYAVSAGTGTGGVDEIVFTTEPANGAAVVVTYQRTVATPAGVLLTAVTTGVSETTTLMPVIQSGQVRRSLLTGLPAHHDHTGSRVGLLVMEE